MAAEGRAGLYEQVSALDSRFWIVNTMEGIERFAYYGVRAVIAIYMVLPVEYGGPEFTHVEKGSIFAAWAAVQSLLPMFTGGLADRFGHKRTIAVAIILKMIGYASMALFTDYWGFWSGCVLLAAGTAIFKPGVQGTLAATLKESSASVGWAIFYQLVNIGGFMGPVVAGILRNEFSWATVFYFCAALVAVNFMWLPFYKDPTQEPGFQAEDNQKEIWKQVSSVITPSLATSWSHILSAGAVACFVLCAVGAAKLTGVLGSDWTHLAGSDDASWWTLSRVSYWAVGGGIVAGASWVMMAVPSMARRAWIPMGLVSLHGFAGLLGGVRLFFGEAVEKAYPVPKGIIGAEAPVPWLVHWGGLSIFLVATFCLIAFFFAYYLPRKPRFDQGHADGLSIVVVSAVGIFQHRVFWFCVVFSGFWFMFNQVFDLLPNVIDDWVDTSMIIGTLGRSFETATVPTILGVVLGLLLAFAAGLSVLLAMRPDRRPATDVPEEAYAVVALAFVLLGALIPSIDWTEWVAPWAEANLGSYTLAMQAGAVGLAAGLIAWKTRLDGRIVAGAAFLGVFALASIAMRAKCLDKSEELIQLAKDGAQINPEWMINLNPGLIMLTVVFFGYLASFVRPLTSIIVGIVVATAGSIVAGTASVGWVCIGGILIFSIGEMLSSPKKMEYLASLAKKGQEGLFMGYANVPVAIGWISGSIFAGNAYEARGDKVNLARRHLVDELGMLEKTVAEIDKSKVVSTLQGKLGMETPLDVQRFLFETYDPHHLWYQIGAIGLASVFLMIVYDRVVRAIDARGSA